MKGAGRGGGKDTSSSAFSSPRCLRVYVSRVVSRILQWVAGLRVDRYLNNKYKRGSLSLSLSSLSLSDGCLV